MMEWIPCAECIYVNEDCVEARRADGCYCGEREERCMVSQDKNAICQWCFEKPPVKDGVYCQECLDAARQEEDKQFDLEKWLEEI